MGTIGQRGYTKLDTILRNLCLKRGDPRADSYMRLLPFAAEGMTDMGQRMDIGSNVRTVTLTPDPNTRRIDWPDDYLDYIKVGFRHNGNFIALGHNPKMAPLEQDDCGNYQPVSGGNSMGVPNVETDENTDIDGFPFGITLLYPAGYGNGRVPPPFGFAGGWSESGYFNMNKQTRTIDFSSDMNVDEIILRYETTGFRTDAENEILSACVIPLERYILYAEAFFDADTSAKLSKTKELHKIYIDALMNSMLKVHGSSNAEVGDVYRQTKGGVVRS